MSDPEGQDAETHAWSAFVDELNESLASSMEENLAAQEEFAEAWFDALDDSGVSSAETHIDGMRAYVRGLEVWMQAIEEQYRLAMNALEGEEVQAEEFRDIWLNAANQAFKEVMRSSAFAAATGEAIDTALEFQRQFDELSEETLESLGFATGSEIAEVGSRLVELERRQHRVEEKLDQVLDAVEGDDRT